MSMAHESHDVTVANAPGRHAGARPLRLAVAAAGLAASLAKTGRLAVFDDSNRSCVIGGEILATAAERMRLIAPPRRVTRPDGAVLPFARELDLALQPSQDQLLTAVLEVVKAG